MAHQELRCTTLLLFVPLLLICTSGRAAEIKTETEDDPRITFELINSLELKQGVKLGKFVPNRSAAWTTIQGFSETGTIFLEGRENVERVSQLSMWAIAQGTHEGLSASEKIELYCHNHIEKYIIGGFYMNNNVGIYKNRSDNIDPVAKQLTLDTLLKNQILQQAPDDFKFNYKIGDYVYDSEGFHGKILAFFRNGDVLFGKDFNFSSKRVSAEDLKHVITNL